MRPDAAPPGAALGRKGKFRLIDRGMALVSMAVAIALGGRQHERIAVLAYQEPVLGAAPSDTTVRRTLEMGDPGDPGQARPGPGGGPRARVAADCATPAGFPWLAIAGKILAVWLVIDLDAMLITAHSDKEGAAPTFKSGNGFHPLGAAGPIPPRAWPCCCGRETPASQHLHRSPRPWCSPRRSARFPPGRRSKLLVRVDGAWR